MLILRVHILRKSVIYDIIIIITIITIITIIKCKKPIQHTAKSVVMMTKKLKSMDAHNGNKRHIPISHFAAFF